MNAENAQPFGLDAIGANLKLFKDNANKLTGAAFYLNRDPAKSKKVMSETDYRIKIGVDLRLRAIKDAKLRTHILNPGQNSPKDPHAMIDSILAERIITVVEYDLRNKKQLELINADFNELEKKESELFKRFIDGDVKAKEIIRKYYEDALFVGRADYNDPDAKNEIIHHFMGE